MGWGLNQFHLKLLPKRWGLVVHSFIFLHFWSMNYPQWHCVTTADGRSCTTWDIPNSVNNGINYLSTGAGLIPSTVCPCSDCSSSMESTILQVRPVCSSPSCRRFKILERRRVLVPGKTRFVSPIVSPARGKMGHIQWYTLSWRREGGNMRKLIAIKHFQTFQLWILGKNENSPWRC